CPVPLASFLLSLPSTPPSAIYTLSLHDALPISVRYWLGLRCEPVAVAGARSRLLRKAARWKARWAAGFRQSTNPGLLVFVRGGRSEEHTSELQSPDHLVCRLLLEKKKNVLTTNK